MGVWCGSKAAAESVAAFLMQKPKTSAVAESCTPTLRGFEVSGLFDPGIVSSRKRRPIEETNSLSLSLEKLTDTSISQSMLPGTRAYELIELSVDFGKLSERSFLRLRSVLVKEILTEIYVRDIAQINYPKRALTRYSRKKCVSVAGTKGVYTVQATMSTPSCMKVLIMTAMVEGSVREHEEKAVERSVGSGTVFEGLSRYEDGRYVLYECRSGNIYTTSNCHYGGRQNGTAYADFLVQSKNYRYRMLSLYLQFRSSMGPYRS
ncbi:hypothetical protein CEXT_576371 [Caerostris extrusa]|uniref:Uncharacterized protein n=1 Tax=Caerostris extrusa TaxID=172846 RepID=A0AAV4UX13_CAEEX|nr:hypothetical protein CEXT_576371 [Caerostris extrusa]